MSSSIIKAELEKEFAKLGHKSRKIRRPEKPLQKRLKKAFKNRKFEVKSDSSSSKKAANLEKLLGDLDRKIDSKIAESVLEQDSRLKRTLDFNFEKNTPKKEETVFTDEDFETFAKEYFKIVGSMAYFRTPIVVLLGATGAGKSKLALELAQRFKGEIISADAMQMYHGLNIATNKVSEEELKKVQHHMIDMLDPLSQMVRVNDFRNTCLPIIEGLLAKNVIPFICGGTNYYIESLIWNILVDDAQSDSDSEIDHNNLPYQKDDDLSIPSEKMYSELLEVDPERASTLHFKERRKIYRSLQIYYRHGGKKHSDFIKDQRSSLGGSHIGGPLRYKNVCFLWVDTEVSILDKRCDSRVDKMIQRGLLDELEDFHRRYNLKRSTSSDYTIGIFQSIGFKEFS
ncbi:miaA [Lepeophtheirus salmonis]|uniref:MiaA n=1 Tax=Lepeophtheirus salmonis TaxID=72036 RepID=A0A7R8CDH4_LEPSM|nr:miaA [Lepeophtheirus salmonis]CAF2781107.1 miaA [Lepeophtheirus salmonis]